jgi:hypothetical protein
MIAETSQINSQGLSNISKNPNSKTSKNDNSETLKRRTATRYDSVPPFSWESQPAGRQWGRG